MGRSTYTFEDVERDLAAGQRAYEARNAQIEEWTAREMARVEREHAEKKAALKAAREKRDAEAAAAASGGYPSQLPGPGQVMPVAHAAPAPCPPPAHMMQVPPQGPVPAHYVPMQGQVQAQVQQQIPIQAAVPVSAPAPAPAQPRIRRSPAETMRDLRLSAICKRRVDNGARTQRINQAEKAGAPAGQEPPLPDEDWYLAQEIKCAVERGDITWKEIKKLRREEEGGCCILM